MRSRGEAPGYPIGPLILDVMAAALANLAFLPKRALRTAALAPATALVTLAFAAAAPATALESDQYLAWGVELEDSAAPLNEFVNTAAERVLARVNRGHPESTPCEVLPRKIFRRLARNMVFSRLREFVVSDPRIDVHPGREVGYFGHLRRSIFRRVAFPFLMPLARTIRVGEVYLGVDKLGHMVGLSGRAYYRSYLRARRQGASESEAIERATRWGLRVESTLTGGLTDGVFSHADLEANFRGLMLARDLCRGEPPFLVLEDGSWRLARPIDLREYVNPLFDESYNPSRFSGWRWKRVAPILAEEYCPRLSSPEVEARLEGYRAAEPASLSRQIIAERFAARGGDKREEQAIERLCPGAPPLLAAGSE